MKLIAATVGVLALVLGFFLLPAEPVTGKVTAERQVWLGSLDTPPTTPVIVEREQKSGLRRAVEGRLKWLGLTWPTSPDNPKVGSVIEIYRR
jgi:hypothetical protein